MRFMNWEKDGGYESTVTGLYIVEIKKLFSIVLLKFDEMYPPTVSESAPSGR